MCIFNFFLNSLVEEIVAYEVESGKTWEEKVAEGSIYSERPIWGGVGNFTNENPVVTLIHIQYLFQGF